MVEFFYFLDGAEISIPEYRHFVQQKLLSESDVAPVRGGNSVRLNCVGFSVNQDETSLAIFPKNFAVGSEPSLDDFIPVFRSLQLVQSASLFGRWGKELSSDNPADLDTNYPFGAFFRILSFYQQFGLHFDRVRVGSFDRGKVNWKKTISNASYLVSDGRAVLFPLYREISVELSHLVTDAMIFSINHTLDIFGAFVEASPVPYKSSIQPDLQRYPMIVRALREIRASSFNDRLLALLSSLIEFFEQVDCGSGFYFKSRNFAFVWQSAVSKFMRDNFLTLDECGAPVFGVNDAPHSKFANLVVRNINSVIPAQSVDIDHYWFDRDSQIQYVFDAKYYRGVSELNYKQLFYTLLQSLDPSMQGVSTVSALILPAESFRSQVHFKLNDHFARQMIMQNRSLDILEIYVDCRVVLEYFQSEQFS